jgi:hypothetical protein
MFPSFAKEQFTLGKITACWLQLNSFTIAGRLGSRVCVVNFNYMPVYKLRGTNFHFSIHIIFTLDFQQ